MSPKSQSVLRSRSTSSPHKDEWSTPHDLFEELDAIFSFTLDACASAANAKCARFFTKEQDALGLPWPGRVWMNPPYSRQIGKFVRKAYEESLADASVVVSLLPCSTDTEWWHRYVKRGQVIYLRRRLIFGRAKSNSPFPSAIVIFFSGRLGEALIQRPY